jgi:hypothetical protein
MGWGCVVPFAAVGMEIGLADAGKLTVQDADGIGYRRAIFACQKVLLACEFRPNKSPGAGDRR